MKLFKRNTFQHLNFLGGSAGDRGRRRRRRLLLVGGITLGLFAVASLLFLPPILGTAKAAKAFQSHLQKGQQLLTAQRFGEAKEQFRKAQSSLEAANRAYRPLRFWRFMPILGRNIRAGDDLLTIGGVLVRLGDRVNTFAEDLLGPFLKKDRALTFGNLSVDERRQLLEKLGQAEPTLAAVRDDVATIVASLEKMPRSYVQKRVDRELEPVRENLVLVQEALARATPIARILPKLLGYDEQQTYLFLLQNNSELRPTGGFIGTYGIMKIRDGDISSFTTDNSYNLDNRVKGKLFIPPPEPLRRYNSAEAWFFRDSNWSPDFSVAAGEAESLYRKEGGREALDGVLAVTPTFIEALLALTGDIAIDGVTFTQDNFVDTLQEQVTFGFYRQGIPESERKEVIGAMGQELVKRLYALPQNQWGDLWQTLLKDLIEKHVLLNFHDPDLQAFAADQGWGGLIPATEHDFLQVVDANLASLKTDPTVNRTIEYSLRSEGETLVATAKITYVHTGSFDKKTTRYRTYTRMLVPEGATLVSSEGADLTDRSDRPGSVDTSTELGKTVFAAFKSIEPGTTESLTFTYTLPARIVEQVQGGEYRLTIQKQPGTLAHGLRLALAFPRDIRSVKGIDNPPRSSHTTLSYETSLQEDRSVVVGF